jgi:hypothetical protein
MNKNQQNNIKQSYELATGDEQKEVDLNLNGELSLSDYISDIPLTKKTAQELGELLAKQREQTRTRLASRLSTLFGCTFLLTLGFVGAAAFNPNADKGFIKDTIPLIITPQVTLLGVALTFYFTAKEK